MQQQNMLNLLSPYLVLLAGPCLSLIKGAVAKAKLPFIFKKVLLRIALVALLALAGKQLIFSA
jgi:hypothetical protein